MTSRILLLISVITALLIYLSIGGFDNLIKQSFSSFYKGEKDENFILNLNTRTDELLNLNSLSASELNLLAMNLLADGHYDQSYKVLNKYIAVYPDQIDAEIYAAYAEIQYLINDLSFNANILKNLEKSLYLDPSNHKALTMKGLYLFSQSEFELALKSWSVALENVDSEDEKKSLILVMNTALKELEIKKNNSK